MADFADWRRQISINALRTRGAHDVVCVCDVAVVRVRPAGWGTVVCRQCGKVPAESFGIDWSPALLASLPADGVDTRQMTA